MSTAPPIASSPLTLLGGNRTFLAIWTAFLASSLAGSMQDTATVWQMTSLRSDSPILVSLMQTASSLPFFLLALPAGALADVVDRRRLLLVGQIWRTLIALILTACAFLNLVDPYLLLTVTFAMSLGATFTMPAWQAAFPEVVSPHDVPPAMYLCGVVTNIARGLGPALAGLLLGLFAPRSVYTANAAMMLSGLGLFLLWQRGPRPQALPSERLVGAMKAAVRYVAHAPAVDAILSRNVVFVIFTSAPMSLFPVVARSQLHLDGLDFGISMTLLGLGAVLVSVFLLPRICSRCSIDQVVGVSAAVAALASAAISLLRSPLSFNAALFVLGAASSTALASLNLGAQLSVPDWVRGRTSSVYLFLVQGAFALGALTWGYAATRWGVSTILLVAAAGFVATAALGFVQPLPQLARMNLSASHHWPAFHLVTTLRPDDGPVLVQIDYEISPEAATEFRQVMQSVRTIRLRDGGMRWVLLDDLNQPGHYRESFLVESWSEHLRQMERSTLDDAEIEERARNLQVDGRAPQVHHFLVTAPPGSGVLKPLD